MRFFLSNASASFVLDWVPTFHELASVSSSDLGFEV